VVVSKRGAESRWRGALELTYIVQEGRRGCCCWRPQSLHVYRPACAAVRQGVLDVRDREGGFVEGVGRPMDCDSCVGAGCTAAGIPSHCMCINLPAHVLW
jgi:hypothetical protein